MKLFYWVLYQWREAHLLSGTEDNHYTSEHLVVYAKDFTDAKIMAHGRVSESMYEKIMSNTLKPLTFDKNEHAAFSWSE